MRGKMIPRCCPACDATDCEGAWEEEEFEFNVTTSDLIAELERRVPCEKCEHWRHNSEPCMKCFWKGLWNMGEALHTDNFKEAV